MEDQRLRRPQTISYQTIIEASHSENGAATAEIPSSNLGGTRSHSARSSFWVSLPGRLLVIAVFFSAVTVTLIHVRSPIMPTKEELKLAQHYYGDVVNHNVPWAYTTSKIRQAQKAADEATQEHLQSTHSDGNNSQRRALRHQESDESFHSPHNGCESTVIILRHCEKGHVMEHCAYDGFERSVYLASLFGNDKFSRWPLPVAIFAEAPDDRFSHTKLNFREIETVGPLAKAAKVTVDDSYSDITLTGLGKRILEQVREGNLCGKTIVVAWKHSRIAHLARVLGCGPSQGCPVDYHGSTFDEVWQIKIAYDTWEHSSTRHHFVTQIPRPYWKVFGSVQYEGFDPLAVSKEFGDYPAGGTPSGGRWKAEKVAYPERKRVSDTAGWKISRVGFPKPDGSEHKGDHDN